MLKPKDASYIDALTDCAKTNSKIASISEMRNYWKFYDPDCRKNFWTSDKPINNSHFINGNVIQKIPLGDVCKDKSLLDLQKVAVASFETMNLVASPIDKHVCICVLYEIRKVHNYSKHSNGNSSMDRSKFTFYPNSGNGRFTYCGSYTDVCNFHYFIFCQC